MRGTIINERAVHPPHLLLPPLNHGNPSAAGCTLLALLNEPWVEKFQVEASDGADIQ